MASGNWGETAVFSKKEAKKQIRVSSLLTFWNILQAKCTQNVQQTATPSAEHFVYILFTKCTQNVYKYIFALAILHRKQTKIQLPWPAAIVLHFAMQNAYTMLFLKDCGCAKMHFCKQNVHKNVFLQRNTINFIKF